ncbi:MAG: hypothetical protein ACKVOU_00465 [Cytophagales bacterium]
MKTAKLIFVASMMGLSICANLQAMPSSLKISGGMVADDKKTAFKKKINQRIDDLDEKIGDLKADMKKKGKKMNSDFDNEIEKLKASRTKLKNKLSDFKEDSKDNWEEFKKDVNNESDKFENEVQAFINKCKN